MKSPFTGKEMKRLFEKRSWKFRGENFDYFHESWLCEDSGEVFTTDKSDTAGFMQVANQYREKYGIPYTDEIIAVREKYEISASKMSLILGFGANQYRLYEQGEVPSVSNGRMIRSIMNPAVMLEIVKSCKNELRLQDYDRIVSKVMAAADKDYDFKRVQYDVMRVFSYPRGYANGFAPLSLDRLRDIMLHILDRCGEVWYTKMNKLLFYIDFFSYRERGYAMTGLSYKAFQFGPVPEWWERVYSEFAEIEREMKQAGDYDGYILKAGKSVTGSALSEDDILIINQVCNTFGHMSSGELSAISHNEDAWINNETGHLPIPFAEAFTLKAV